MDIAKICAACDHTLLKTDCTKDQIKQLCDEAIQYHAASVCIPPAWTVFAKDYLEGRMRITNVIGFPNGYMTTASKVFEAKDCIANGADEIDMVINVNFVKSGMWDEVTEDIRQVREATKGHILKVIIECCLLTDEEKIHLCHIVTDLQCDFIKTSTGFSTHGATFDDVKLLRANVGPNVRVKAAGGIHSLDDAQKFLELGASRLGTSNIIKEVIHMQDVSSFVQTNTNIDREFDRSREYTGKTKD